MQRRLVFLILVLLIGLSARIVFAGSWTIQESGTTKDLSSVHFVDANNGWVVGRDGLILHTDNGGITWDVQEIKIKTNDLYSVFFIDRNRGWVGGECVIFYTVDGGKNWKNADISSMIGSICFVDKNNGWASGLGEKGGIVFHTNDGGQTWATQTTIASTSWLGLPGVHFVSPTIGLSVWGCPIILYTKDGGRTWGTQTSGNTEWLRAVCFADSNTGWILGYPETILYTINGGKTWGTQTNPGVNCLTKIHFIGSSTGWIAGEGGKILHTTNGGEVWNIQDSGTTNSLYDICFVDHNNGWAVGENGIILKYSEEPFSNYSVIVYPNPCKTEDKYVTFGYPSNLDRKLTGQNIVKIYTIAGELVKTIEKTDKDGRTIWDMTNNEGKKVASGIYIYILTDIQTGKEKRGKLGILN